MLQLFLDGKNDELIADLQGKMQNCSETRRYEMAAVYRDQVRNLREVLGKQTVIKGRINADIFAFAHEIKTLAATVLFVRAGRVLGQKTFFSSCPVDAELPDVAAEFLAQYYLAGEAVRVDVDRVVSTVALREADWLQKVLQDRFGHKLRLLTGAVSGYGELVNLANLNVRQQLEHRLSSDVSIAESYVALQQALSLPFAVSTMECFDISHTFGASTVASCVVFDEYGPQKSDYRRFNIKDVTAGDDYAAMRQALQRRYTSLKKNDEPLPDLLVIDGGKGQMRQAIEVLDDLQITGVMILAVAKGRERKPGLEKLWVHGIDEPISLPLTSPAMRLIQAIRDEAHRFAISGHRKKRNQASLLSQLEEIPGIGKKRRQALLEHFGGRQGLLKASLDELCEVPGIGRSHAEAIYAYLLKQ